MITLDIKEFKDNIKSLEDVSVRKHTGGIQYLYDTIYSAIINGNIFMWVILISVVLALQNMRSFTIK